MGILLCKGGLKPSCDSSHKPERCKLFGLQELEVATGGFAADTLLGKGSHGCVYKGILGNGKPVAVKRTSYGRKLLEDEAAFDNEVRILSKLNDPRLVKLLGFCEDPAEKVLVVEFMPNGTLNDILHSSAEPLSWSMRAHLALQTAKAILVLHKVSPPIIHRDIKSSNVLIDRRWNAKLGDFGLALWGHDGLATPPAGTLGYLDPEYTTPDMLSPKNDVFSFGILLLEIMSGRKAIDVRYNPPSILEWALPLIKAGKALAVCDPKLRPPRSKSALRHMAMTAARCVRNRSARRPTMVDVVGHLQEISKKLTHPMFCIKRRITARAAVYQKREISVSPHLYIKSPRRAYPRTPKVHDENPGILKYGLAAEETDEEAMTSEACSPPYLCSEICSSPYLCSRYPVLPVQRSVDLIARECAFLEVTKDPEWQAVAGAKNPGAGGTNIDQKKAVNVLLGAEMPVSLVRSCSITRSGSSSKSRFGMEASKNL